MQNKRIRNSMKKADGQKPSAFRDLALAAVFSGLVLFVLCVAAALCTGAAATFRTGLVGAVLHGFRTVFSVLSFHVAFVIHYKSPLSYIRTFVLL